MKRVTGTTNGFESSVVCDARNRGVRPSEMSTPVVTHSVDGLGVVQITAQLACNGVQGATATLATTASVAF